VLPARVFCTICGTFENSESRRVENCTGARVERGRDHNKYVVPAIARDARDRSRGLLDVVGANTMMRRVIRMSCIVRNKFSP